MTVHIDFEPVGRRCECSDGKSLLECARLLGVDLVNLCGGSGSCGRCVVQVLDGEVSEPTAGEGEGFAPKDLAQGYRLACRTTPLGDCRVRVPPDSLTAPQRTQVEGEETLVTPEPIVLTYLVDLHPPSVDDLRAGGDRVADALAQQNRVEVKSLDLHALRCLLPAPSTGDWRMRAAVRDGELVTLLPPEARALGLAVDLGTTKIAAYLMDLEGGQTLASRGLMNPQIAYGEDVIARLAFAWREDGGAEKMQSLVVEALSQAASAMCDQAGADPAWIVEAVVVGNTAMHHLFLRLPVESLARAPYVPAASSALDIKARDLGLAIAQGAYVHLLPNIAGYVGADHVAMLLAIGAGQIEGNVLAIDIGTNTEVCLVNRGTLTSVSCASGPAFEGAHIKHGMRAGSGAIEHLRLTDGQIELQVIGDVAPVGICGSGILDALAQLHLAGVVDRSGRLLEHARVTGSGGRREFLLAGTDGNSGSGPTITFTQQDVRELQLAKGAMRAGIDLLLEARELGATDLDQVIIAGAFGTYIDPSSAIEIGMLPHLPLDRIRQVGNAAGMGAKQALISRSRRQETKAIGARTGYIELASVPHFSRMLARAMYLS